MFTDENAGARRHIAVIHLNPSRQVIFAQNSKKFAQTFRLVKTNSCAQNTLTICDHVNGSYGNCESLKYESSNGHDGTYPVTARVETQWENSPQQ